MTRLARLAILCPITSRNCGNEVRDQPFFKALLPSLIPISYSRGPINLFLGYDKGDSFWEQEQYQKHISITALKFSQLRFHWIEMDGLERKITSIWNYLETKAREQGYRYLFPANDDLVIKTDPFQAVRELKIKKDFGICGFDDASFPDLATFYFVGRTHFEIFDSLYPLPWEGAHQDSWIADVYRPWNASEICDRIKCQNRIGVTGPRFEYGDPEEYRNYVMQGRRRINSWLVNHSDTAPPLPEKELENAHTILPASQTGLGE